jgi:hypothetical protein
LLAKNVNDDAGCLNKRGEFAFFASKLAPTGLRARLAVLCPTAKPARIAANAAW